jgi:hypothetical protein
LQPELLKSGNYVLSIGTGPSLAYPIKAPGRNHIQSYWGASRDGGSRSHEGVDMFAKFHTPVVAAANGRITRVNENNLGGKVIFMRPYNKSISLYYAHLDSQLVQAGKDVKQGDTIGLMGNTGNARSTAPHLHFGIYTSNGAVDPFPFINPQIKTPAPVRANTNALNKEFRFSRKINFENGNKIYQVDKNTVATVSAATSHQYKIMLPDSTAGFINENLLEELKTIRSITIKKEKPMFEKPDTTTPVKIFLKKGAAVQVIGEFKNFHLVIYENNLGWMNKL